ncbi:MAG TPA: hypothetical protein VM144_15555 [Aestuariivirga sp.]|nr:hypothetical protein [Aestuariivirga sp.]
MDSRLRGNDGSGGARTGQAFVARDLVDIIVQETRAALVEVEKLRSAA